MKIKKWFDFKDGANYLGLSTQELYAIVKYREFDLKDHIIRIPNKRMISEKGLKLLINIK